MASSVRLAWIFIGSAATFVLAMRLLWPALGVPLLINTTVSEPRGIYRVARRPAYSRGMLVVLPVPASVAALVTDRGWLARGVPLIKGVGAVAGDRVCVTDEAVTVNGSLVGPVYARDSNGRPLPVIRGCERVPAGEFWPLSAYALKSFDGRYMGAQPVSSILGEAVPVWTR